MTKYLIITLDHVTPHAAFSGANSHANRLVADGKPFGIWSCLVQEWAQEPNDPRITAPNVIQPRGVTRKTFRRAYLAAIHQELYGTGDNASTLSSLEQTALKLFASNCNSTDFLAARMSYFCDSGLSHPCRMYPGSIKRAAAVKPSALEAVRAGVDHSISTYYVDGKPHNPNREENNARRRALGLFVNGHGLVLSLPAHLNKRHMPDIDDVPALLDGDSIVRAMIAFNTERQSELRADAFNAGMQACDENITDNPHSSGDCELAHYWFSGWFVRAAQLRLARPVTIPSVDLDKLRALAARINELQLDYWPFPDTGFAYGLLAAPDGVFLVIEDDITRRLMRLSDSWKGA